MLNYVELGQDWPLLLTFRAHLQRAEIAHDGQRRGRARIQPPRNTAQHSFVARGGGVVVRA